MNSGASEGARGGSGQRGAALLGVGAALAALIHDPQAAAADAKRAALLAAAAAGLAAALGRTARGGPAGSMGWAGALWIAFVGWSGVSVAWGRAPGVGTLEAWGGATGLMIAAAMLPGAGSRSRRAAGVAAAGIGGGSALIALAQYAAGARGFAVHGGHGNPNWLGLVLAIALPLTLDLAAALRREKAWTWMLVAALVVAQAPALYLSRSRVAWVATAVTLLGWAATAMLGRRGRAAALGLLAAAGIGAAVLSGARAGELAEAMREAQEAAEEATATPAQGAGEGEAPLAAAWEGRNWIWQASADAAAAALPLGVGLGGFAHAYLDAQGERLAGLDAPTASRRFLNATTAHNDWIQAAVEGGAPGLLLLAAAIGAGLSGARRGQWRGGAASLVAFAICGLGDSPMHQPAAAALVALTLGAARAPSPGVAGAGGASGRARRRPRPRGPGARRALLIGALVAAAILLAAAARSWIAARWVSAARDAAPATRVSLLERAARLDPWNGEAALSLGLARLELGDAAGALPELLRSRELLANVGTEVAIGNAQVALGEPERAAAAYARALRWSPGSFRAHANAVEAMVRLGRLDEADRHLAAARSLWPGHPKLGPITERLRRARVDAGTRGQP